MYGLKKLNAKNLTGVKNNADYIKKLKELNLSK